MVRTGGHYPYFKMEKDLEYIKRAIEKLEAPGDDDKDTSFRELYKNWGKYGSQEERRKELLQSQKGKRSCKIDSFRGILELIQNHEEDNLFKPYDKVSYRPNIYVPGFNKPSRAYSNVLMLSEWLVQKPNDFETNWYISPCPKGVRVLVIAYQGITKCYTKFGKFKFECKTGLPGGSPETSGKHESCVLDCFYDSLGQQMYVLDLLAWKTQPMTDGEMEFRQFWLKSYLDNVEAIKTVSKYNKIVFKLLPMIPCSRNSLNTFLSKYPPCEDPEFPCLDGFLFYHKQAHYVSGQTPLVGWLFPYMITEILGSDIPVNPEYFKNRPNDYTNQAEFIQKFEVQQMKKKDRRGRRNTSMEFENCKSEVKEGKISAHVVSKKEATEAMESESNPEPDGNTAEQLDDMAEKYMT
ncbi:unnamed protein product [Leptosia nina]|uniref:Snurportin-1 n=1 Tax=Leptosia nina TaxID=320188 RepID=A0AAV1J867_9NEOP